MIILALMGYKPRVSFMTGVTVAQISEFSLILGALGLKAGHIGETEITIITLVGIFTIAFSSYGIIYTDKLFHFLHPVLRWLDFHKTPKELMAEEVPPVNHIILAGAHRLGSHILDSIPGPKKEIVIVDFNPDIVHHYNKLGYTALCGDIGDPYMQEISNLHKARLIISTIPDINDTLALFEFLKRRKKKIQTIVTAQDEDDAELLYKRGANYVLVQHFIGGLHLADVISAHQTPGALNKLRNKHIRSMARHDHH